METQKHCWVIRECESKMMWIKEFIEFVRTKSGGMMSDDKALVTWNSWVKDTFLKREKQIHESIGSPALPCFASPCFVPGVKLLLVCFRLMGYVLLPSILSCWLIVVKKQSSEVI